ncbi:hypothetical protein [Blastopirellula marina]|uniref:Peptidase C-terminal archaeal/bacterial domain-containing protein n=1 Tax=Blastopirellula marina TaxID=124 RepID=A0A2S8GKA5_9BACT|nr:hypothetical protein [Blastopirellula marina]PQO44873.1 hypothetical protein C5Y93_17435 [Blastopirellula marina]
MLRFAMLLGLALVCFTATTLPAAPRVTDVSLRGLTAGKTTRLTLQGNQLGPNPEIKLDFPTNAVRVLPESNAKSLVLEIDLPEDAPPRHGKLRVATATGISSPVTLGIDALPSVPFAENIESLPIAMTGSLTGAELLATSFQGTKGEQLVIEVEAQRLGSKLLPLVSIVDERDTQLAYSSRVTTARDDARFVVELPEDGTYTIKLQDALFRGGKPGFFRLKVGEFRFADLAFPLALRGKQEGASLNLLTTADDDIDVPAILPESSTVEPALANVPVVVPGSFSGRRPRILHSDIPEFREPKPDSQPGSLGSAPLGISGVLAEPKERDVFLIDVTPGTKYRAEVFAERIHSPVDAVLVIQKADGGKLAASDDQNDTPDPATTFDVPEGVTQIKLLVRDVAHAAGPTHAYRVTVTPESWADFTLQAKPVSLNIPAGGSTTLEVVAKRRGFDGAIKLNVPELPEGLTASLDEIPARADRALVTFSAAADANQSAVVSIVGTVEIAGRTISRVTAIGPEEPTFGLAPENDQIGIGIIQKPKLLVAWSGDLPETALGLGQVTALPVRVTRGENQKGSVRFSLITSQVMPQKDGKPDPSQALRLEKELTLPADQSDATLTLVTPTQLKDIAWDVAVKGELLAGDGKKVLATAESPARRFSLGSPLFLALTGEAVVRLKGTISRAGGFQQPVIVVANGLPKEAKSDAVEVAADQSEFTLEITLPPGIAAEQLANVKLVATAKRNGEDAPSNQVPIRLDTGAK